MNYYNLVISECMDSLTMGAISQNYESIVFLASTAIYKWKAGKYVKESNYVYKSVFN